jgi:hypothetical protein
MSYTVTLDGIVLRDEPMGLESAKLQVYRDTANPGIFNIFTADYYFFGGMGMTFCMAITTPR